MYELHITFYISLILILRFTKMRETARSFKFLEDFLKIVQFEEKKIKLSVKYFFSFHFRAARVKISTFNEGKINKQMSWNTTSPYGKLSFFKI